MRDTAEQRSVLVQGHRLLQLTVTTDWKRWENDQMNLTNEVQSIDVATFSEVLTKASIS